MKKSARRALLRVLRGQVSAHHETREVRRLVGTLKKGESRPAGRWVVFGTGAHPLHPLRHTRWAAWSNSHQAGALVVPAYMADEAAIMVDPSCHSWDSVEAATRKIIRVAASTGVI